MIWNEAVNHHEDRYFCVINITGINQNNLNKANSNILVTDRYIDVF